jgi:hypothetical protein
MDVYAHLFEEQRKAATVGLTELLGTHPQDSFQSTLPEGLN